MENSEKAVDFFEQKGAEFRKEFSALFSKYNVNAPVNGYNIAKLSTIGGQVSQDITDVLNSKSDSNFGGGALIQKIKGLKGSGKVKGAIQKGTGLLAQLRGGGGSGGEAPPEETKPNKNKYIIAGIIVIVVLIVVVVVIKKASK